jgi:hypothetical protein
MAAIMVMVAIFLMFQPCLSFEIRGGGRPPGKSETRDNRGLR